MTDDRFELSNPDDEVIPPSPGRRRAVTAAGCLMALVIVALLLWFIVERSERSGPGLGAVQPQPAGTSGVLREYVVHDGLDRGVEPARRQARAA